MRFFKRKAKCDPEFIFILDPNYRQKIGRGYDDSTSYKWVAVVRYKDEFGNIKTVGLKYGDAPAVLNRWLDEWPAFFKDAIKFHNAVKTEEEQSVKAWRSKKVCTIKSDDDVECVYEVIK